MVGPSTTDEERERDRTRLKVGFVGLVGGSTGIIAFQGGADPVEIAVVTLLGLLTGGLLLVYLTRVA